MAMTKKKKKLLLILLSVLLGGTLIYSITWIAFYYTVVLPHKPSDFATDPSLPKNNGNYITHFCPDNAYGNSDLYRFNEPRIGTFICPVGFTSARNYIESEGITVNMSGSKFAYSMGGRIGWNGKIRKYAVTARYYSSPEVKIPEGAFFIVDHDGNLLNADDRPADELELFKLAKEEIIAYIAKIDEIFDCG